jgi:hypothetical protein
MLFIAVLAVLSVTSTKRVHAINQINILNNFANESWKSIQITFGGQTKTIEQHIVDAFNGAVWGSAIAAKINTHLNEEITKYYNSAPNDPANTPNKYNSANPTGWTNNLATDDSPRQWMRNLNLREIYRFKNLVNHPGNTNLVNNANYATDDLVKARALCGTFWIVDTTGTKMAIRAFGGMLIPGQAFGATYQVHTCMHGFSKGNDTNNIAYYFVPYGVRAEANIHTLTGDNPHYVTKKGFRVTHIHQGDGINKNITDDYFKITDPPSTINNTAMGVLYSQNDYAKVTIKNNTDNNTSLYEVLKAAHETNPIGAGITTGGVSSNLIIKLPDINADDGGLARTNPSSPFDPTTERLFVIGYNSSNAALDHATAVSATLTNDGPGNNPRRSVRDDQNTKTPPYIQIRNNEYFSSLATFPGISGGPVLRCRLHNDNGQTKKCACIGTVFGAERKFTVENQLDGFANFTNKP